mmetsp:Transcript_13000/g.37440  ORF Transcript_13000/g.37440 Transcript_13000/m.37440 type:complete len:217 (+) Transcript_13000:2447-3097(+)
MHIGIVRGLPSRHLVQMNGVGDGLRRVKWDRCVPHHRLVPRMRQQPATEIPHSVLLVKLVGVGHPKAQEQFKTVRVHSQPALHCLYRLYVVVVLRIDLAQERPRVDVVGAPRALCLDCQHALCQEPLLEELSALGETVDIRQERVIGGHLIPTGRAKAASQTREFVCPRAAFCLLDEILHPFCRFRNHVGRKLARKLLRPIFTTGTRVQVLIDERS